MQPEICRNELQVLQLVYIGLSNRRK